MKEKTNRTFKVGDIVLTAFGRGGPICAIALIIGIVTQTPAAATSRAYTVEWLTRNLKFAHVYDAEIVRVLC